MPNHLHGVLFINKPDKVNWDVNKFGSQRGNLAAVIRGYKASVKAHSIMKGVDFAWQPKYHDRVIRDDKEYYNVKEYIRNNPQRWLTDPDNSQPIL